MLVLVTGDEDVGEVLRVDGELSGRGSRYSRRDGESLDPLICFHGGQDVLVVPLRLKTFGGRAVVGAFITTGRLPLLPTLTKY